MPRVPQHSCPTTFFYRYQKLCHTKLTQKRMHNPLLEFYYVQLEFVVIMVAFLGLRDNREPHMEQSSAHRAARQQQRARHRRAALAEDRYEGELRRCILLS